jgi:uncharacterized membrane protein
MLMFFLKLLLIPVVAPPEVVAESISFKAEVQPLIRKKCATAVCHGGPVSPVLLSYGQVKMASKRIKVRISDPKLPMPPAGFTPLTPSETQKVLSWIQAGTPNN